MSTAILPSSREEHTVSHFAARGYAILRGDIPRGMVADASNGALLVYPGSHRIPKRTLQEIGDYGEYVRYLRARMARAGIAPQLIQAKAGDVLFWHGDLVHAGGVASDRQRTRFSYLCHYARIGSEPQPIDRYSAPADAGRKLYITEDGGRLFL